MWDKVAFRDPGLDSYKKHAYNCSMSKIPEKGTPAYELWVESEKAAYAEWQRKAYAPQVAKAKRTRAKNNVAKEAREKRYLERLARERGARDMVSIMLAVTKCHTQLVMADHALEHGDTDALRSAVKASRTLLWEILDWKGTEDE